MTRSFLTWLFLNMRCKAVPWLRRLVAGLSLRRPGLAPGLDHVGSAVDEAALGHVFLRVIWFSSVNIIPLWLSTLISFGGRIKSTLVAAAQRQSLTEST
jgi:hypothetical protein